MDFPRAPRISYIYGPALLHILWAPNPQPSLGLIRRDQVRIPQGESQGNFLSAIFLAFFPVGGDHLGLRHLLFDFVYQYEIS